MIRTVIIPVDGLISFEVPTAFNGQKVEVIAFTIAEAQSGESVFEESLSPIESVRQGLEELRLYNEGKIAATSAKDFLHEF